MKNKFITVCFLLFSFGCFGQQKEMDSLLLQLKKNNNADTIRLKTLVSLAFTCYGINPEAGLNYSKEAVTLAQKLNEPDLMAHAWSSMGTNYTVLGEKDSAFWAYGKAVNLYTKSGNKVKLAAVLSNFGGYCVQVNDLRLADSLLFQSLNISRKLNDKYGIASAQANLAMVYMYSSDFKLSIEYGLSALTYFESISKAQAIANIHANLGNAYRAIGKPEKALEYYKRASYYFYEKGIHGSMATVYISMAIAYNDLKDFTSALKFFDKGLSESEACNYKPGISSALMGKGLLFFRQSEFEKALPFLERGIRMQEEVGDLNNLCLSLSEMGNYYLKIPDELLKKQGINPKDRFIKALFFENKALTLAKQIESQERQRTIYENLSKINEASGNFKASLDNFKKSVELGDSIINIENATSITRLEEKFVYEKKDAIAKAENDKREALAQAEIKQQRTIKNATMAGIVVLMIASLFSFVFYKKRRDAVEQRLASDFKVQVTETEMKALRAQMNPHFIFNSLNSIGEFIAGNDLSKADLYISKFARVMRLILENSEHKTVTLADDLKALEMYMQLEALRMNNKFRYEIHIDKAIDPDAILVPPLILQPFVENSIWHGISKKEGEGLINIKIVKENDMINCIVEDNGVGRKMTLKEEVSIERKSLGMKITQARIDILNRIRKTSAEVKLSDLTQGLRVEVRLPLIMNF